MVYGSPNSNTIFADADARNLNILSRICYLYENILWRIFSKIVLYYYSFYAYNKIIDFVIFNNVTDTFLLIKRLNVTCVTVKI